MIGFLFNNVYISRQMNYAIIILMVIMIIMMSNLYDLQYRFICIILKHNYEDELHDPYYRSVFEYCYSRPNRV